MSHFKKVTVIGAGFMGSTLAFVFAKSGSQVHMIDQNADILDRAMAGIKDSITNLRMYEEVAMSDKAILDAIHPSTDMRPHIGDSDFILEVIIEKPEAKKALFADIAGKYKPEAIVSSNTSVLNAFELMPESMLPRAAMTHFFSPAHLVPLVEVVTSPKAESDIQPKLDAALRAAAMKPVFLNRFVNGFIVNRLQRAINREAYQLVDDGYADAATIDEAVKTSLAIRFPVTALMEKNDQAGLDLIQSNYSVKMDLASHNNIPKCIEERVAAGHLGFKSGKGFYDYSDKPKEEYTRERDEKLMKVRKLMRDIGVL
ncbi:NAD-binding protein [Desulfovibrio sp. OttesenSCG-928-O18]|nr:NAD-binding protein [Desulfovibrio sp. OttesenSCG-928-O18]